MPTSVPRLRIVERQSLSAEVWETGVSPNDAISERFHDRGKVVCMMTF